MNKRHGGMMITAVVTILLLAILGTAMVALIRITGQRGAQHNFSERAYYMAQAGLAFARNVAATNVTYAPAEVFTVAPGEQFELVLTNDLVNAYARVIGKAGVGGAWEAHHGPLALTIPLPPPPEPEEPPEPPPPPPPPPAEPIVDESVFVAGASLVSGSGGTSLGGSQSVIGEGATVVVEESLNLSGSAHLNVSTIYTDNDLVLQGSSKVGSSTAPGKICVAGALDLGPSVQNHIYGEVFVGGDFYPSQARIYGNVYVQGNVVMTSGGGPQMIPVTNRIYYGGSIIGRFHSSFVAVHCVPLVTVPSCERPDFGRPALRPDDWYAARGYVASGAVTHGLIIFADGYTSSAWRPTATNVIIVSKGDISITQMGGSDLTGVLIAPNGKVTFGGRSFTGTVLAKNGFEILNNATITFRNLGDYFESSDDYPVITVYD